MKTTADTISDTSTSRSNRGLKKTRSPNDTPAMRQFARFKEQFPDCLLLFRMGDFYELFHDDAVIANKVLGITLTQRTKGIPMAGVPYHAVDNYLRKLIEAGHRVAVCDQIQDPKEAKGIVDRAVTRVLTPGTLVDESLLSDAAANQIAAIQFLESGDVSAAVLAMAEVSTGSFTVLEIAAERIIDELTRLAPSELLYVETADGNPPQRIERLREALNCAITARPAWTFRIPDASDCLREHFAVRSLNGFGLDDDEPVLGPAGALFRFLQETQTPDASQGGLGHLQPPRRQLPDQFVIIDGASLQALEIERTMRSGSTDGSLLSILQRCHTSMGKRLLREWLCFPLRDKQRIEHRQQAVAAVHQDQRFSEQLIETLSGVQDVARIAGRIAMRRANPRDLVALGDSTAKLQPLIEQLDGVPAFKATCLRLKELAGDLTPLCSTIQSRCVDSPPAHLREGGLFRDGVDAELDEARGLQRDANAWLAAYQKKLIEESGIGSLKVGYNRVFGYYIEITHANAHNAPDTFTRKQTLKNAERYITPELKTFEEKVTTAEARAIQREKLLFERLCTEAAAKAAALSAYAQLIAQIDVLICFAEVARRFNFVRPTMVESPIIDIRQGRHPVLDRTLGDRFVPNDCQLGLHQNDSTDQDNSESQDSSLKTQNSSLALITGPNMAGKSTFIRQTALIVLLAHTGCFVPAEAATIGLTDRIFTRIGASDALHAGKSTFMVEMTETANILHHATQNSVVILDEIGRGTSTLDGLSLAWAIAEALADRGCRTLFATHYHELTNLAEEITNVTNLHVAVREWGDEIIFLYRIEPGRTNRSYGVHVAKIAGLPTAVIDRASQLLETLAVHQEATTIAQTRQTKKPIETTGQLELFTEYVDHPAINELRELKLNNLSPMQAFDALRKLRQSVETEDKTATP